MDLLQSVMDSSTHAIFILNQNGIIDHINEQAKTRFGLFNHSQYSHAAGKLEKDDIVILADTAIGADDGNLRPEDLNVLGIHDKKIHAGDACVAVARYDNPECSPVYKFYPGNELEYLKVETEVDGIPIMATIKDRTILVNIKDSQYIINYFLCVAQLIILDGKTGQVKFWEENGYTARKEGAGDILRGGRYIAKSPDFELNVVGHHFSDYFEGDLFETHLRQIMNGEVDCYENQEYRINGFELVASLLPVYNSGALQYVIVRFRNIEDIQMIIKERNDAIKIVEKSYKETRRERNAVQDERTFLTLFGIGSSADSSRRQAYKLSQLDCNILITGESGTGKSFLAEAISHVQPRKGVFVKVDCSTIVPTLFESEMFGYVKGSFTGADPHGKAGFFEEANGGTIFLDEIGEIPLEIQTKLLNVIQNKVVTRVGSTKAIPVDVRILAATNRDLKAEVAAGRFRRDLYYRLSTFTVNLPPLRDCPVDTYFIINNLIEKIPIKYGIRKKNLSGEAFAKLTSYDWPGNIRELENILEQAIVLSDSDIIYAENIHLENESQMLTMKSRLAAEEKKIILQALMQNEGNKLKTMQQLGISKTVFYRKLKEYDIH